MSAIQTAEKAERHAFTAANMKEADRSRATKTGLLYELATCQSDHLEDLVMFEGGAAAKCARPSWISHRSAWRTAT
jgi:hypothetical protein